MIEFIIGNTILVGILLSIPAARHFGRMSWNEACDYVAEWVGVAILLCFFPGLFIAGFLIWLSSIVLVLLGVLSGPP